MMKHRTLTLLLLLALTGLTACHPDGAPCEVTIGDARCSITPYTDARFTSLTHPGGYAYVTGGHRGMVVCCLALGEYAAYERTCPCDNTSKVAMSADWAGVLECPTCHSCYDTYNHGAPFDDNTTLCALYEYSVHCDGTTLQIY